MCINPKKRPLVSVIMGVYNSQGTLSEAVMSILNQTYSNFEFLICDDGSTDDSLKLLGNFSDKRIKILRNEVNRGLAFSLNKCLVASSGAYVARMDADDVAFPDRLETQLSFLEKNKKNSKKHLQKILRYDIINLGHAREIKIRNSD